MTTIQRFATAAICAASFAAAVSMVGCGAGTQATTGLTQELSISGKIFGGQQPVTGSHVYLFGVGGFIYGSTSNSLLTSGTQDASGNYYVTSDPNGNFTISSKYTCPSYNTNLSSYLLAVGGNPGLTAGTNNTAITMIAALGPCSGLSASTFVNINEVSTAASVTALQQFMVDETHIGAPSNPTQGTAAGIVNAFATVANLESLAGGNALAAPATGSGVSPQAKLNTLGNILAACVNTSGPTSTPCAALFAAVTPSGTTKPTTVAGAMLLIAKNPGYNVATTYPLGSTTPPFAPSLASAPNDFSLGITYTGGGLTYPGSIAIDSAGDIFTANCPTCNSAAGTDSLVGYSTIGVPLTGATGFTTNIHKPTAIAFNKYSGLWSTNLASGAKSDEVNLLDQNGNEEYSFPVAFSTFGSPNAIAIDASLNAWVSNPTKNSIVKINSDDTNPNVTVTSAGFTTPSGVAVDGFGNVYASGMGSSTILKFSQAGTVLSTPGGYTGSGLSTPVSLTTDGGQHVWTVNTGTTKSITELFGYDGTADSGTTGYAGINQAANVSIDGAGTAWIANCRKGCATSGSTAADNVIHLSTAGASLTPSDGLQNTSLSAPTFLQIDYSGNVWIANSTGASLTELVGVAVPVVNDLNYAVVNNLLPSANLLSNPGFENGSQSITTVPSWTLTATGTGGYNGSNGAYTEGGGHTGFNTLTEGASNAYTVDVNQTIAVANGNYLVSCFAEGTKTQNSSLSVTGYNAAASTLSVNIATTVSTGAYTLYSIPNVPVTNGSITVNLNTSSTTGGGYMHFDDCSVTKQ